MRLQWAENFEPDKLSKTEIKELEQPPQEFNGGDNWLEESEEPNEV